VYILRATNMNATCHHRWSQHCTRRTNF